MIPFHIPTAYLEGYQMLTEKAYYLSWPSRPKAIFTSNAYSADEAFLSATPFCILPTTHLNSLPIGEGKIGTVTQKLLDRWSENVGVNIVQQIQDYAREIENWQKSDSPTPYQFRKK